MSEPDDPSERDAASQPDVARGVRRGRRRTGDPLLVRRAARRGQRCRPEVSRGAAVTARGAAAAAAGRRRDDARGPSGRASRPAGLMLRAARRGAQKVVCGRKAVRRDRQVRAPGAGAGGVRPPKDGHPLQTLLPRGRLGLRDRHMLGASQCARSGTAALLWTLAGPPGAQVWRPKHRRYR